MPHPHQVAPSIVQQNTDGLISNLDYDADNRLLYAGFARPGTEDADLAWQIQKLTWVDGKLIKVRYANYAEFNQSWDSRSSLVYS